MVFDKAKILSGTPRSITRFQMSEAGLEYNNKRNQNVRKRFLFANEITEEIRFNAEKPYKKGLFNQIYFGKNHSEIPVL